MCRLDAVLDLACGTFFNNMCLGVTPLRHCGSKREQSLHLGCRDELIGAESPPRPLLTRGQ